MTREQYLDDIVTNYGMESRQAIFFATLYENGATLIEMVQCGLAMELGI